MRSLNAFLIFMLVVIIILIITNPSKEKYTNWIIENINVRSGNVISQAINENITKPALSNATMVQNYFIYSYFNTHMAGQYVRVMGIFDHFIVITDEPD